MNLDCDWVKNEQRIKHEIVKVKTVPFSDPLVQNANFPTMGLRRPSTYFERKDYIECFTQAAVDVLDLKNQAILVGGLGNKLSNRTVLKIVRVAAGNKVQRVYMSIGGVMTLPAMSHLAKQHSCWGFSVFNSCSPVPTYDENFMAINLIDPNGWIINPHQLNNIVTHAQLVNCYSIVPTIAFRNSKVGHKMFIVGSSQMTLTVVDAVAKYTALLKEVFDFDGIKDLVSGVKYFRPFRILIDSNNGAAGPYTKRIFEEELGAGRCLINSDPSDNPKTFHPSQVGSSAIDLEMKGSTNDLGASLDGDGSRCVIYGCGGFPIPVGETLAVITSHYQCMPFFQKGSVNGVSRSFFTSSSVDDVAQNAELRLIKTPGYWLYFNRLINDECISLCEDENFRVGSRHVGVSDGIWTILAWMSLVAHLYKPVKNIMVDHWAKYGRHFMTVYEFHEVLSDDLDKIMHKMKHETFNGNKESSIYTVDGKTLKIVDAGVFPFCFKTGPEITLEDTFLRVTVEPKGLIMFRTVVLGKRGTFRIVVEVHSNKTVQCTSNKKLVTDNLFKLAMNLSDIQTVTGRNKPDLIY